MTLEKEAEVCAWRGEQLLLQHGHVARAGSMGSLVFLCLRVQGSYRLFGGYRCTFWAVRVCAVFRVCFRVLQGRVFMGGT